ncbi:MFS general substrate transporter [Ceraceosorus guamensis]|uniref:MFS general substrate transporter n=1 Tax=Ceraceosorus guamensis TaxID=1522189 RepID=A0A316W0H4_9BASI|nr:MFS general substrate transporter [Ceraceosorus guamensis]PWN43280.1 MFS general substrate transporter [Ceraceosorus guamensis]
MLTEQQPKDCVDRRDSAQPEHHPGSTADDHGEHDTATLSEATHAEASDNERNLKDEAVAAGDVEAGPATPAAASNGLGGNEAEKYVPNEQTNYVPRRQIIIIFFVLAASTMCSLLDQSTLAVAIPIISTELGSGTQSAWISSAYFLTSTSFQLLYGRISDICGRKNCLLGCVVIFFFGSLASSLARTTTQLAIFRAFTGIGGGGLITLSQVVISDVVSLRQRGTYQGILGAVVAVFNGVGPIIGGAFASKASWRDIFRLQLPLSAFSFAMVFFFLPAKKVHGSAKAKFKAIDWLGAILTLASSLLIVLGLTWGGGEHPWSSSWVLGPLIVGGGVAVVFCLWEWKGTRLPLMPLQLFRKRIIVGGMICQLINGWVFLVQIFYITQFYQLVFGYPAIIAAALIIPLTVVQTLSSTASGLILSWTGTYRWNLLVGWIVWSVAMGLFSTLREGDGKGKQIGYGLLAGVGVGNTLSISLVAMQGAVERKDQAVTTAARNFFRNLGGSLGLAVAATIINNVTVSALQPLGWSTERIEQVLNDPSALLQSSIGGSGSNVAPLSAEELSQLREAYRQGFSKNFYLLAALTAAAFFVTVFLIPQRSVDRSDDQALRDQAKKELDEKRQIRKVKNSSGETSPVQSASDAQGSSHPRDAEAPESQPSKSTPAAVQDAGTR